MNKHETKEHQDKFYAHKIGKEIYITSRRQIVHDEYFIRMDEICRFDKSVDDVNSNPIIGSTDFYFGYLNIEKDSNGNTIGNQIGGEDNVLVNAPMLSNIPRMFREIFEDNQDIHEVKVEYLDSITLKKVTPVFFS